MPYENPEPLDIGLKQEVGMPLSEQETRWAALVENHHEQQYIDQTATAVKIKTLGTALGSKAAEATLASQVVITAQALADIPARPVYWLWDQRIPIGEITLVAGKGGVGKSILLCTMAAWITRGSMRGVVWEQPQNVIYVANEDSYDKAVKPRMLAAGADMSRVYRIDVSDKDGGLLKLALPLYLNQLEKIISDTKSVAIFMDPLSSNMMDKDRNSPEVRASYERLRDMADRANVAIIGNAHTRKGQSGDLLEAIMGSSEIGNVARAALGVMRNPDAEDHEVIVSQCKNNYGPSDLKSYTYRFESYAVMDDTGREIYAPRIIWGESTTEISVNKIISEPPINVSATDIDECVDWLKDYLGCSGMVPRKEVVREAAKEGHKEHTLKRAARRLRIASIHSGYPRVAKWQLPPQKPVVVGTVGTCEVNLRQLDPGEGSN